MTQQLLRQGGHWATAGAGWLEQIEFEGVIVSILLIDMLIDALIRVVAAPLMFGLGRAFHLATPVPGLIYALTGLWHSGKNDD